MKKFKLSIFLIIVLILFSSCQKNKDIGNNDKEIVTLACPAAAGDRYFNKSQELKSNELINNFNAVNDKYMIEKYQYESGDKLLLDIMSGRQPDLLYVGDWIDMTPMYGKELLCDLNEFIDADSDVSRDIYVNSVLNSLEINGKLYQMPHNFVVHSAVVKSDLWDGDTNNSIEHILERAEQLGCETPFDFSVNSIGFMSFISSEFIDFENGTCCFDDGRFKKLLVVMKKYNDAYGNISANYPNGAIDLFNDDKIIIMYNIFASLEQLNELSGEINSKMEYIGFPSDTPNFHIAMPIVSFSIFENSSQKEGAFEFIKYYTDYNTYIPHTPTVEGVLPSVSCLPINQAVLDYILKHPQENMLFTNVSEQLLKENREEAIDCINSINGAANYIGYAVNDVLYSEISTYLAGDKTVDEVCEIIQNRLSTYFSEQYS